MDDLMAKLQSVLNDEESMKQINELAGMLTQGQGNDSPQNVPPAPKEQSGGGNSGNFDFSQLLQGLGLGGGQSNSTPISAPSSDNSANGFDIAKLMQLQSIMQTASKPDKNVDLLLALKPLLKEENQLKIDRLVKIFKLFAIYPVLKESGLLGGDLFGLL